MSSYLNLNDDHMQMIPLMLYLVEQDGQQQSVVALSPLLCLWSVQQQYLMRLYVRVTLCVALPTAVRAPEQQSTAQVRNMLFKALADPFPTAANFKPLLASKMRPRMTPPLSHDESKNQTIPSHTWARGWGACTQQ